jgi:hypothetical protein
VTRVAARRAPKRRRAFVSSGAHVARVSFGAHVARVSFGACVSFVSLSAFAIGCNVAPVTHDECHASVTRTAECPGAALVVMSDFSSTQIALTDLDGRTRCGSFISSARAETTPVSYALSGDVVLPSTRPTSNRVVVIDRYGTNVVSFLDPGSGAVLGQLAVGSGFEANIQDYLELDETRALVSRWGENPAPGQQAFDAGGDLLVIDTQAPAITGRIALPRDDDFPPRPAGLTRIGDQAVVTLQRFSVDIRSQADAMLVGIDAADESIAWQLTLAGLKNCGPLTPAPAGDLGVLACTGFVDVSGAPVNLDESALVLFDLSSTPPMELTRFFSADLAGEPLQADVEFYAPHALLLKTQTALGSGRNNRVLSLDLDVGTSSVKILLEARPSDDGSGQGVVYGGMLCTPGCGDRCLVADADRRVLERWRITEAGLEPEPPLALSGSVGLAPRDVGGD